MAECEVCGAKIKDGKRFCDVCAPQDDDNEKIETNEPKEGKKEQVEVKKDGATDDPNKEASVGDPFNQDFDKED